MINYNGQLANADNFALLLQNRAYKYGDGLFETIKIIDSKIIFSEDHYFRLMASMRMLRMEIAMDFTLEYFENQILGLVEKLHLINARVRFTVFRDSEGLYLPDQNKIAFYIEARALDVKKKEKSFEVDLFKDYYVYSGLLSTLKTNNRILNVIASNYAHDNELDNCLLLNESKHLVEAINGNLFLVNGTEIRTPALSEGCIKGIVRKNLISLIEKEENYSILETKISPFELLKADEVFITNSISGIQSVTKYRKKIYEKSIGDALQQKLDLLN